MIKTKKFILFLCLWAVYNGDAPASSFTIYCRDAFAATWGRKILERFPDKIKIIKLPSAGIMTRLRLENSKTSADMLLGIDTTQVRELEALQIAVSAPYNKMMNHLPVPWPETTLIPLAYGVLTVLTHTSDLSIKTLDALCEHKLKIILADPRTSTTGLEFLYWIQQQYGDQTLNFWKKFKDQVLSYSKGLSSSFAIFSSHDQFMTVAYSTSPLYARRQNAHSNIQILHIEGAPVQVYGTIITQKGSDHPLAGEIINFLRSPEFQQQISHMDDLYPATSQDINCLPSDFPPLPLKLLPPPFLTPLEKDNLIQQWLQAIQD